MSQACAKNVGEGEKAHSSVYHLAATGYVSKSVRDPGDFECVIQSIQTKCSSC